MAENRSSPLEVERAPAPTPIPRLLSLDALRGFDMFWIIGGDALVAALRKVSDAGPVRVLAAQLEHEPWEGFAFYDLIFPLFIFIVGVSIVFSLGALKGAQGVDRGRLVRKILVRGLLLFVLGVIYNGGLRSGWSGIRIMGVLQRIAICYVAAALLFQFLRPRALAGMCLAILLGYWSLLALVPIRDVALDSQSLETWRAESGGASPEVLYDRTTTWVTGRYEPGYNLADHLDFRYLPLHKYDGAYDPEGLLSTLPSIVTCLLGVFAGLLLSRRDLDSRRKLRLLLAAGVAALALGLLWGLGFPIIKKIWTSSYVLVAAGSSALLLAAFYYLIDMRGWRRWAMPFVWIGMNPITIYLARNFFDFNALANRLVGGPIKGAFGSGADLVVVTVSLALSVLLVWYMHRRRIFVRL
jgi:predicted acyltransferase